MSDQGTDKLRAAADFDGPTKNRHCTDVLCSLLLVAHWVVLTGIGIYAVVNGDVRLILNPLDYSGNICGTDFAADMTEYPNLLYVNNFGGGVCVKKCPNLNGVVTDNLTDVRTLITYGGIWQVDGAELDPDFIQVADYSNSSNVRTCTEETCFPNNSTEESWTSQGVREGNGYAFYAASTYELLNRCILTSNAESTLNRIVGAETVNSTESSTIDDVYNFWNKLFGDIYIARKYILGFGFGLSTAVSFIYIFLMRMPLLLTGIIWTSILGTIVLFFVGGYYAWNQASIWADAVPKTVSDQTINATSGCSIALFVIGGILVLLACCLRNAIMLAIKCTKEAGRAVNSMVLVLLVPVIQTIGFLLFMVAFVYYGANLASLGEITTYDVPVGVDGVDSSIITEGSAPNTTEIAYRQFVFDDFTKNCGWYMLFSLFWTSNFIVAMGDIIIAMSVAKWYFTKNKLTIGSWTVLGSIQDTAWYHTGTAAFGSLLIAIVQLIRAIIARLQKEAKKVDSKIAQCLLCCCQCCFWCLEKLLKFISKNAYIQTAIFSTSFCSSCRASFALIFRNAARIAAVSYVSAAVLIIGKLFISSLVTVSAYYYIIESGLVDQLYSVGGPVCVVFLISYWLSDFFMDVLDMGISTVLHCFIADEEMFEPDERYCERSLKDYVDNHGGE